jgi:hypothetical protein
MDAKSGNPLFVFLKRRNIKHTEFCDIAAVHGWRIAASQVSRWASGARAPGYPIRAALYAVTAGGVPMGAWGK